jgi:hypothetical protein
MSELAQGRQPTRTGQRLRWSLASAGVVALVGLSLVLLSQWRRSRVEPTPATDRWASFTSPYLNVRQGVQYVGDQVCAQCHVAEAESFRKHPMGRDLAPLDQAAAIERYGKEVHNPFEAFGYRLHVERRGGQVFHQVAFRDPQGRVVAQLEREIQFVIGSGTRTYSYLMNQDGYLFESPITWFPQAQIWDISPGFPRSYLNGRPVREACLFCHCNHAEHVPGTENRYRPPLFTGYAIGCERCHGPGELHVALREKGEVVEGADDTIVNPGRLEPVLRESVCQQCHLEGSNRILRRGREPFDYRPGLPLHQYLSVFFPAAEYGHVPLFVGQVEQMYASRCFRVSNGKMGCISCHDPHAVPAPEEKVRFFRGRCLNCHQENSCQLSPATRRHADPEDSCIRCHMPRRASEEITHTAVTEHRILRNPGHAETPPSQEFQLGGMPLTYFFRDQVDEHDPDVSRDLGLALLEVAWGSPPMRQRACALALPLLEEAVGRWPDEVPAREAKGKVLWLAGRQREGLAELAQALVHAPDEERILETAATMATTLGDEDMALAYWQRAVAINPWKALYHVNLAKLLANRQEWPRVQSECQAALRVDPFNADARRLLVTWLLREGKKEQARTELDTLSALQPGRADELRRWFAEQSGTKAEPGRSPSRP